MKELQVKEQIMLAYYAQYFQGASAEEIKKLDERLSEGIGGEYADALKELQEEGLVNGLEKVMNDEEEGLDTPMATNEGMLYVNNVLNLQSYAVEEHQLDYLKRNLETSHLNFTLGTVEEYIREVIQEAADESPNENSP